MLLLMANPFSWLIYCIVNYKLTYQNFYLKCDLSKGQKVCLTLISISMSKVSKLPLDLMIHWEDLKHSANCYSHSHNVLQYKDTNCSNREKHIGWSPGESRTNFLESSPCKVIQNTLKSHRLDKIGIPLKVSRMLRLSELYYGSWNGRRGVVLLLRRSLCILKKKIT